MRFTLLVRRDIGRSAARESCAWICDIEAMAEQEELVFEFCHVHHRFSLEYRSRLRRFHVAINYSITGNSKEKKIKIKNPNILHKSLDTLFTIWNSSSLVDITK